MKTMVDPVEIAALARRAAALAIFAVLLWLAVPFVTWPFAGLGERAEALETETGFVDRLARLDARRASVASLAGSATPPFIVAPDADAAMQALQMRVSGIVPPDRLRIDSLTPLPQADKPGAPIELSMSFSATEGGFYALLSDLETRPPFVRVGELSVKSSLEGSVPVIAGTATLSAVPLLKAQP